MIETLLTLGFTGLIFYVLIIKPVLDNRRQSPDVPTSLGGPAIPPRSPRAKPSAPAPDFLGPGTQNQAAAGTDLLSVLAAGQHVLVIGPTRAGKTSLIHELAQRWRAEASVLVLDPDAAPGLWPGCTVSGAGDDFSAIDTSLAALLSELEDRRRQRASGVRRFAPVRVILTEAADLMHNCDHARPVFEAVLRRGAKLGIGLVVDVQDRQRKTLAIDGATHLLDNFDVQVEVRKQADGRRVATVTRGEDSTEYAIPPLPDLDQLQAAAPVLPAAPEPAHDQTHTHTNTHTPQQDAELSIPPVCVPTDRDSLVQWLAHNGWTVSQVREVVKGDFKMIGQLYRDAKEGDTDEQSA